MLRPLKLKVQQVPSPLGPVAIHLPIATVWVDSGIPNLTEPFNYLIPEKLSESVKVGSRVQIPFRERHVEGLVIERGEDYGGLRNLKQIQRVLGEIPVATRETISLIAEVAKFWAGAPFDVIRSAIPPRVATAEKDIELKVKKGEIDLKSGIFFHLLPPKKDPIDALIDLIVSSRSQGSKLVIVPTQRELSRLSIGLSERQLSFICLSSSSTRAERYRNFLITSDGSADLVIGMRGAVFAPIANLCHLFVHQEDSEHYFERRAPYWNARDVAIMRAKNQSLTLALTGFLPSPDVTALIESKQVSFKGARERINLIAEPSMNGELIPSKIYQLIRSAIKKGPVLFLVPSKGYASAISCAKCRNMAVCECGGKLIKVSAQSAPSCTICFKIFTNWKCGWCNEKRIFLLSRGIERFSEEIGRSFPNIKILHSSANGSITDVSDEPSLVISTPGVEPIAERGYHAVVVLQVDRFLSSSSVVGQHQAYASFFAAVALSHENESIAMVCEDGTAITSAISTWNPATIAKRENEENRELNLPPTSLALLIIGEVSELLRLRNALAKATTDSRTPKSLRVFGPSEDSEHNGKLTLLVDPVDHLATVALAREVNNRRSLAKKELFIIRIKPYSIN